MKHDWENDMTERNTFTPAQEALLTALEGGKYEQGRNDLCRDGKYCCLGVATHTVNPEHPALSANGWAWCDYADDYEPDEDGCWPYGDGLNAAPDIVEALCLVNSEGSFRFGFEYLGEDCLVELNDAAKLTFPKIAAFTRKHPWAVFTNFDKPETDQ